MQSATNKTKLITKNKRGVRDKKSITDYAIIIDFLFNIVLLLFFYLKIRSVFQMGFAAALESDFGIATGSETFDEFLVFVIPIMGILIPLSFITEVIYFSLKLRGKQPFITEKYAIIYMFGKIITIAFLIIGILVF